MKEQILVKLNDLKAKSGKSYEAVHEALGYATSTVHRWHRGESEPDLEQLTNLVEFYGGSMEKLFAVVGKLEMTASQDSGYQGVVAMSESYEARLQAKDEQMAQQRQYYEALMAQQREHYDRSIEYLKKEADWLRTVVENLTK
jgi:transcriptional regulator with XRE-family HTH domain